MAKSHLEQVPKFWGLAVGFLFAGTSPVYPLSDLGPGGLLLDLNAEATYDSNIFKNSDGVDDYIVRFTPTLTYQQERGLLHLSAFVATSFFSYLERDDLSDWDPSVGLSLSGLHKEPAPRLQFGVDTGWRRRTSANSEVGAQVRSELTSLSGEMDFQLTEKSGINGNASYNGTSYAGDGYADNEEYSASLAYVLISSEKLSYYIGGRYRVIDYSDYDLETSTVYVGAAGDLTSKLTGSAYLGITDANVSDKAMLYYNLDLRWAMDLNTSISMSGQRDYQPSALGSSSTTTSLSIGLEQRFTESLNGSVSAFIGRDEYDYENSPNRKDDYIGGSGRLSLNIGGSSRIYISVDYEDRSSEFLFFNYDRWQVNLGGSTQF